MIVYEYERHIYGRYEPYEGIGDWLSSAWHAVTSVVTKPIKWVSGLFHHEKPKPNPAPSASLATSFAQSAGLPSLAPKPAKGYEALHQSLLKDLKLPSLSSSSGNTLKISTPSTSSGGSLLSSFAKHVNLPKLENPPVFHVTSHKEVSNPFLDAIKDALKTVGQTVIQASTQALAQGIAFKIQKELGLVPKIQPAPAGGYNIVVHRPPSYSPPPPQHTTVVVNAAPHPAPTAQSPSPRIQSKNIASVGGVNLNNKTLLLLGGLLLLTVVLSSRR